MKKFFAQCKLILKFQSYKNISNKAVNSAFNNIKSNNNVIGIPRAISYYNNFPFYYGFFKALGYEVVLSDKTTTSIINNGSKYLVSDTCFPIKVYVGHLVNLLEKGIRTIFVPSIQSVDFKINNCSKVRGLPEIIRNVINEEFTMIEPTLDKTENLGIKDFCKDTAIQLGIYDESLIAQALQEAWSYYDKFLDLTHQGHSYEQALDCVINNKEPEILIKTKDYEVSVVVMAHGYNLFDERISLNLLKKLEQMNVKAYTGLNVTADDAEKAITELGEIRYWANELDLTGTAGHYLLNHEVDGIVALSAFGCGPDSLMVDEIAYHCRDLNVPLIHLTIDEHTGEAGFVTRLEAFVDMMIRRKRLETIRPQIYTDKQNSGNTEKIINYTNIKKLRKQTAETKEVEAQ